MASGSRVYRRFTAVPGKYKIFFAVIDQPGGLAYRKFPSGFAENKFMAITLKDLASELGMSAATVSRCLRDHPDSDMATRQRVKALAAELGYSRSRRGRPSRTPADRPATDTTQIGVLARRYAGRPGMTGYVLEQLLEGMAGEARRHDASLHIHKTPPEEADNLDQPQYQPVALARGQLDGLVIVGELSPRFLAKVSKHLPCVSLVERMPGVSLDCVDHDDADSVSQLVDRLTAHGHQHIGFVSSTSKRSVYLARYGGLLQALIMRGLPCDPSDTANVYGETVDMEETARVVYNRIRKGVTGWIAAHDGVAYNVMEILADWGLSAPRDYSIAAFDNLPKPDRRLPDLVSIQAPFATMGAAAVRWVKFRLDHPDHHTQHTLFPCSVVEGESLGPPPNHVT
jgi:DNA-binding LacI/PurR family transcriptional regulator